MNKFWNFLFFLFLLSLGAMGAGCRQVQKRQSVTLRVRNSADHLGVFSEKEAGADYDSMTRYMADKFSKNYKKCDVTILTEYYGAKDEPKFLANKRGLPDATDIVLQDAFLNLDLIYSQYAVPLDDVISKERENRFYKLFDNFYKIAGRCYQIPYSSLPTTYVYNAELFRQAGLEAYIRGVDEVASWSMGEWALILDTLRKKLPRTVYPLMMQGASADETDDADMVNMTLCRAFGCPFFGKAGECVLDCELGVKALNWVLDGKKRGWFPNGCEELEAVDRFQLYTNGQLAIYFGNNVTDKLYKAAKIDSRHVLFPSVRSSWGVEGRSFNFSQTFCVLDNGDETKIEVAKDFLRYILEDEELKSLCKYAGEIPAALLLEEDALSDIPNIEVWREISPTRIDFANKSPNYKGVRKAFSKEFTRLLKGELSAEKCAKLIQESVNEKLAFGKARARLHE